MIIVFNINYQLQYSPSYTGTLHGTCEVQDFNYCKSFANAMQALLGQNYNSFLLLRNNVLDFIHLVLQ